MSVVPSLKYKGSIKAILLLLIDYVNMLTKTESDLSGIDWLIELVNVTE